MSEHYRFLDELIALDPEGSAAALRAYNETVRLRDRSARQCAWGAFVYSDVYAGFFRWSPDKAPPHDLSDPAAEGVEPETAAAIRDHKAKYQEDGDRLRWAMATEVLEGARDRGGCELADPADNGQREALVKAFAAHAPLLREAVGMHLPSPATDDDAKALDPATGILLWDARLADYLRTIGDVGGVNAEKAHDESTDPNQIDWTSDEGPGRRLWALWTRRDKTPRAWFLLGWALWFDVVRAQVKEAAWQRQNQPVAIPRQQVLNVVLRHGRANPPQIGPPPPGLPVSIIEGATRALRSYPAYALLGRALKDATRQWQEGAPLVGRWEFPYGERQLAAWLDAGGGDPARLTDPATLREYNGTKAKRALEAAAGLMMPHIDPVTGTIVTPCAGAIEPGKGVSRGGRKPTRISLALANDFLPGQARVLADGGGGRRAVENKRLTPWLDAPLDDIGRTNEWGAYAAFALRIIAAIRDDAERVYLSGGAKIDPYKIGTEEMGIPDRLVRACLDRWQRDTNEGPGCFRRLDNGLWTIAESYPNHLAPIRKAGEDMHKGRKRQRNAARGLKTGK